MRPRRALATLLITLLIGSLGAPPATAESGVQCTEYDLPVRLGLFPQTVHGTLCLPTAGSPKTVQLLVHGGTYNRHYWDLPYHRERYSYQRDLAARGLATFAADLPGSGSSSQPLSGLITGTGLAGVVHQIVGKLRNGQVSGRRFDRVVLVGHSMGSGIVAVAAATYRDVDGVILTGFTHSMDLLALTNVFVGGVRPAPLDPVLSHRGSDPGYVTTMPGTRRLFHDPGRVESRVLDADETTKDQVSAAVVPDLLTLAFTSPLTRSITAPVLIANGELDTLFCADNCASPQRLADAEAAYFATRPDVFLLPEAGHSLGLAANSAQFRTAVYEWVAARFPG